MFIYEQDRITISDDSLQELDENDGATDKQTNTELGDDQNDFDQSISANSEESEIKDEDDEDEV